MSEKGFVVAPLGRRLAAGLVDLLVMAASVPIASLLTGFLVGWFFEFATAPDITIEGRQLVVSLSPVVIAVILLSYEPAWTARLGRTPGKAAMGLWVVTDKGHALPLPTAFFRGLLKVLSVLPLGLGLLNVVFDKRRKTWHDLFLRTNVSIEPPIEVARPELLRDVPTAALQPAHPMRRLGARLADGMLLLSAAFLVLATARAIAILGTDAGIGGVMDPYAAVAGTLYGAFLLAVGLYEIALIALRGQTLGKMLFGVRIVGLDGRTPGWGVAFFRWVLTVGVIVIPYVGIFIAGFVFLWVAWDRRGQGLHDKIAGTRAVADEPGIRIVGERNIGEPNV